MYLSLLYFLFSANACLESSIKFIIFESSNSIFLPDKISNIINYKETVRFCLHLQAEAAGPAAKQDEDDILLVRRSKLIVQNSL